VVKIIMVKIIHKTVHVLHDISLTNLYVINPIFPCAHQIYWFTQARGSVTAAVALNLLCCCGE
jgi:hypothetical protein